jgi:hypothetical protein
MQGQAWINHASASPVLLPSLLSSGSLMRQTKASHYGKKPYKYRTVSNRGVGESKRRPPHSEDAGIHRN